MSETESVSEQYLKRELEVTRKILSKYRQLEALRKNQKEMDDSVSEISEKSNYNKIIIVKLEAEIEAMELEEDEINKAG